MPPSEHCEVAVPLLREALNGSWRQDPPTPAFSAADLADIFSPLVSCNLASLAWWKIRNSPLADTECGRQLAGIYRRQRVTNLPHQKWIADTVRLLRGAGIEPVLVRDWAVALLYPQPGLRPLGHMDLCVPAARFAQARAILALHPGPRGKPVDLHEGFARLDNRYEAYLYEHSRQIAIGTTAIGVLSPENHLRLLCTHALRHGVYHPKWLCDVALLVENAPANFDWDRCLGTGNRAGWVAIAVLLAQRLLGADIANTPFARSGDRLPAWVVNTVTDRWTDLLPPAGRLRQQHPDLRPLVTYLHQPRGLLASLRARWPNRVEATVRDNGSFAAPAFYNQLRYSRLLAVLSGRRFPAAWRDEQRRHRYGATQS